SHIRESCPRRKTRLTRRILSSRASRSWLAGLGRSSGQMARQRTKSTSAVALWPHYPLVTGADFSDALVVELLYAFALIRFGGIDVALGVDRDAVDAEELAGLTSAAAE